MEQVIIDTLILLGADPATAMADGQAILAFELALQGVSVSKISSSQAKDTCIQSILFLTYTERNN